jgi:sugar/nucleoside kinase (ribokinase family)
VADTAWKKNGAGLVRATNTAVRGKPAGPDVVIVGEANVDVLLYGLPETLPLERELLSTGMNLSLGGSSAITAHNLAALGTRVGLLSVAADDAFAALCLADLKGAGVDLSRVLRAQAGTATGVSVLLQHERARRTLTYLGTTAVLRMEDLDLEYIAAARHLHFASYFLQAGLRKDVPALLAFCKQAGLTVSLDPNDDPTGEWSDDVLQLLRYVDILMPNERELCHLAHEDNAEHAISKLRELVPILVVKQGRRGAMACDAGRRLASPAVDVDVVDAVGAGDSFNAGFLHGYLQGWELERCLQLGNIAGAFSTTAMGGTLAFRDRAALAEIMARHGEPVAPVRG